MMTYEGVNGARCVSARGGLQETDFSLPMRLYPVIYNWLFCNVTDARAAVNSFVLGHCY